MMPARAERRASPAARTTPETQEAQVTPTTPAARAPREMAANTTVNIGMSKQKKYSKNTV